MERLFLRCWLIVAAWLPLTACTSFDRVPTEHIVMFNERGRPVAPRAHFGNTHSTFLDYEQLTPEGFDVYLDDLFAGIETFTATARETRPSAKKRVLIFIHGGLNSHTGAVGRAVDLHDDILEHGYYPIFVNWQSSLFSNYSDHLWRVRQGKDLYPWGTVLAPYYLAEDLVRGVGRLPHTAYFELVNLWDLQISKLYRWLWLDKVPGQRVVDDVITTMQAELGAVKPYDVSRVLHERYRQRRDARTGAHPDAIAIAEGADRTEWSDEIWPWFSYVLTLPTKLVSAIAVDAGGSSAWNGMLRGVRILFHAEEDFRQPTPDVKPSGGLSLFMRRFRERYRESPDDWEIVIVGHSMGTIVLNELVRQFRDIRYDSVVYMAAACSIRDYQDTLFPYLRSPVGKSTEVFHLTLHELAEAGERSVEVAALDPVIRGSLLVWIDHLFERPKTQLDLTLGRYTNLMTAIHNTPRDVWGRVHVKSFDVGSGLDSDGVMRHPQKHGDFTVAQFWRREFWEPDGQAQLLPCEVGSSSTPLTPRSPTPAATASP